VKRRAEGTTTVDDARASFEEFVRAHDRAVQRFAWLLTGDWAAAEDLVQIALTKVWRRWTEIEPSPGPRAAYLRRTITTTYVSSRRRRWLAELSVADPEPAAFLGPDLDTRAALRHYIRGLSRQQRAVIALRYFDDLTEAETAAVLGFSVATVKTHARRALTALSAVPGLQSLLVEERP
jgi:RNA polymerase sigma-70 factor (sigma-E family)